MTLDGSWTHLMILTAAEHNQKLRIYVEMGNNTQNFMLEGDDIEGADFNENTIQVRMKNQGSLLINLSHIVAMEAQPQPGFAKGKF